MRMRSQTTSSPSSVVRVSPTSCMRTPFPATPSTLYWNSVDMIPSGPGMGSV